MIRDLKLLNLIRIGLLMLALILALSFGCFAVEGEGEGNGQNQEEPLTLVLTNISDGQQNIPLDAEFHLEFSKNVVHMTVAVQNKSCFTLTDLNGNSLPVEVLMGDDQVDPTIKRMITVMPKETLTPGSYTLHISEALQSKSGVYLEKPVNITFRTVNTTGNASAKSEASTDSEVEQTEQDSTTSAVLSGETAEENSITAGNQQETESALQPLQGKKLWILFSAVCFLAAAMLLLIYAARRMKR